MVNCANRLVLKKKNSGGFGEMFLDYHLVTCGCFFMILIPVLWGQKKWICSRLVWFYTVISRPDRTTARQSLLKA